MKAGIDLGYSSVKGATEAQTFSFPSIVGTPDRARFGLNGAVKSIIVQPAGMEKRAIGEGAVLQSRFANRREDRDWIESDEYRYLLAAAFSELTTASRVDLQVVTGLPIRYYVDRAKLQEILTSQIHKVIRDDRHAQQFNVTDCRVIPQPFGTVLSMALDNRGRILDNALATGNVGIIDIGGKTTNLLSVYRLGEVGRETTSVDVGAWDVIKVIREYLVGDYPGLEKRDHEIVDIVTSRKVKFFGEEFDLSGEVDNALEAFAGQVISQASQLWGSGARLDKILVSGGGALLLGKYITKHFRHAEIVENPVYANAIGYLKFAQRMSK